MKEGMQRLMTSLTTNFILNQIMSEAYNLIKKGKLDANPEAVHRKAEEIFNKTEILATRCIEIAAGKTFTSGPFEEADENEKVEGVFKERFGLVGAYKASIKEGFSEQEIKDLYSEIFFKHKPEFLEKVVQELLPKSSE